MPDLNSVAATEVARDLRARVVGLGLEVSVLELGPAGLLIETTRPFALYEEHTFELLGDSSRVIRGRVVYSHRRTSSDEDATYVSGFTFSDATTH
jgi:hypothetical protein